MSFPKMTVVATNSPPSLRPYQAEGIEFLRRSGRAILADDTGLGKSSQALIASRKLAPRGRILIVAGKSAAGVWEAEARKWLGEEVSFYQGTSRWERELREALLVVTNYHLLREVGEVQRKWDVIIYDEAHRLRHRKTKSLFLSAKRLIARHVFFLTGTPVFSNAGDLWPPLNLIDNRTYSSYWRFVQRWAEIDHNGYGYLVSGVKDGDLLYETLTTDGLFLRRTKQELPDLPPKVRQAVPVTMTPKQAAVYNQLTDELLSELEGVTLAVPTQIALLTRLRQLLVCPRLLGYGFISGAEEALLDELNDSNEPVVVYTPFPSAFSFWEFDLNSHNRPNFQIHGGLSQRRLADELRGFAESRGPRAPVLLASVLMAEGWAATRASVCYFMGYDWTPMHNQQAEDRLYRPPQTKSVTAKYFTHKGTVDEHVMDILDQKITVAQLITDPQRFLRP